MKLCIKVGDRVEISEIPLDYEIKMELDNGWPFGIVAEINEDQGIALVSVEGTMVEFDLDGSSWSNNGTPGWKNGSSFFSFEETESVS